MIQDLITFWREKAKEYTSVGAVGAANTLLQAADQLEAELGDDRLVTIAEAVKLTNGYTEQALRQMVHRGELPQADEEGPIRVRVSDLPRKAGPEKESADVANFPTNG